MKIEFASKVLSASHWACEDLTTITCDEGFKYFMPLIGFGALYLQLLEAAQGLSLSLTKVNKSDVEMDANENARKDKTDYADKLVSADKGSVITTPEMGPDEV